jgi:hypothetical protein
VFHRALGKAYGTNFGVGDVIGLYIKLTDDTYETILPEIIATPKVTPANNQRTTATNNSSNDSGSASQKKPADTKITRMRGSEIRFYINGIDQSSAFQDIPAGTYYAAVSSYYGGRVRSNFGPQFEFAAAVPPSAKPLCEAVNGFVVAEPSVLDSEQVQQQLLLSPTKTLATPSNDTGQEEGAGERQVVVEMQLSPSAQQQPQSEQYETLGVR